MAYIPAVSGCRLARVPYTGDGNNTHLVTAVANPRQCTIVRAGGGFWEIYYLFNDRFCEMTTGDEYMLSVVSGGSIDVGNVTGLAAGGSAINGLGNNYVMYILY